MLIVYSSNCACSLRWKKTMLSWGSYLSCLYVSLAIFTSVIKGLALNHKHTPQAKTYQDGFCDPYKQYWAVPLFIWGIILEQPVLNEPSGVFSSITACFSDLLKIISEYTILLGIQRIGLKLEVPDIKQFRISTPLSVFI